MFKTLYFQCSRYEFDPCLGKFHMKYNQRKKERKKKPLFPQNNNRQNKNCTGVYEISQEVLGHCNSISEGRFTITSNYKI